jgi:hypothetical protein
MVKTHRADQPPDDVMIRISIVSNLYNPQMVADEFIKI